MILIAGLAYALVSNGESMSNAIPALGALAVGAQRMLPVLQQGYSSLAHIKGYEAVLDDTLVSLEQPLPSYVNQKEPETMTLGEFY